VKAQIDSRMPVLKFRTINRWLLLILSTSIMFFYASYFWLSMLLRNRIILGGKRK
jgi:hypothetical protein